MFRQPITLYKAIWFLPCPCNISQSFFPFPVKSLHYFPHETFYYTYFHYTYKKQSLFASGNGNKDYFFQLGIVVTDR